MLTVKIDFDAALPLANKLDALASRALTRLRAVDVVNEVATRFDAEARRAMNAGLNLSDEYIAQRMRITRAAPVGRGVRAEITGAGSLTILSHYPHAQLTQPASSRARGDLKRGIPPGRKQAGIATEIRRGDAKAVPKWFTMTLRGSGKVGVFYRDGERVTHKYGPAPYSLFRHQIGLRSDDLEDDLRRTATAQMADAIERALA